MQVVVAGCSCVAEKHYVKAPTCLIKTNSYKINVSRRHMRYWAAETLLKCYSRVRTAELSSFESQPARTA